MQIHLRAVEHWSSLLGDPYFSILSSSLHVMQAQPKPKLRSSARFSGLELTGAFMTLACTPFSLIGPSSWSAFYRRKHFCNLGLWCQQTAARNHQQQVQVSMPGTCCTLGIFGIKATDKCFIFPGISQREKCLAFPPFPFVCLLPQIRGQERKKKQSARETQSEAPEWEH